ncbi:MAG: hypothetical protein JSR79_07280 [Proteobacteria bacterium]|nr:hypothetical protein [Pseudomonadota bacterium]
MTKIGQPRWFTLIAGSVLLVGLTMSAVPTLVYAGMAKSIVPEQLTSVIVQRSMPTALMMIVAFVGAILLDPRRRPAAATNSLGIALLIAAVGMVYGLR